MLMGMIAAVYLFNHLDAGVLKKSLGVFIVIYAAYSLLAIRPHTHKSPFWSVPAGLLGGFVSTLFGTGGPFYVIYLQLKGAGKATFRATVATVFLIDGSGRIVTYGIGGIYTIDTLLLVLVSVPIMIIAMVAGGHIHTNISQQKFQKAIGLMLLGSGSALIFS